MQDSVEKFYAKDRQQWRNWLKKNHKSKLSVWLVFDKGENRVLSYDDIVEEALCFGWVDSKPGKVNDTQSKLYISKRKPKSAWSKANKERVKKLSKNKLLQPAGFAAVEVAKKNGAWNQLNKSDNLEIPKELKNLLSKNKKAKTHYESFPPSSKKIILEWIYSAKKEETKMKRIEETVTLAAKGIKAHHYRQ